MARSLNYSTLKKVSRQREVPILNEDDLEESFIKGRNALMLRLSLIDDIRQGEVQEGNA
jgi:hypothetical protein